MVAQRLPSTIVGRERETSALRNSLDLAIEGQGSMVLVSGEAGIGKSTLLACLSSDALQRGVPVLLGAADVQPSASPYGPWIDLLNSQTRDSRLSDLPAWPDLGSSLDRFQTRGALFHEIHQFFVNATAQTPLLLILEDLHRADSASLELLRYLNRHLHSLPVLLVCSYRADELSARAPLYHLIPELVREAPVERVQPGRLDDAAVRALISDRYRLPVDDQERLARYVHGHAEGNPLFITELFRVLEEEHIIARTGGGWTLGTLDRVRVPPLVRQIVDGRLRHLDDEVRRVISTAAVLGRNVPLEIWQQVAGVDEIQMERAIDAAIERNILLQMDGETFTFSHILIQEVLQSATILPRRRNIHRRIADAMIAESGQGHDADLIAHHLWAARDDRAAAWLIHAGERASNVYAWEVADERLTRALELVDDTTDPLRIRALRLRGAARAMMGSFDHSLADRQAALSVAKQAGDPQTIWQALIDLGDLWTARDYQEVGAYYQQALDLAREMEDPGTLAHSLNRIGNWYTNIDQPRDGLAYHDRALELFRSSGDEGGVAQSLDLQAMAAYLHGDMAASAGYYRDAIRMFREQRDLHGLASSLPTLMVTGGSYDSETVHVAIGSDEEWLRYGDEGLTLARQAGWRAAEAFTLIHTGLALGPRGAYQRALDYAGQGLRVASDIDHREWVTAGHYALGVILVDCLNTGRAIEHLNQAYESARATHSLFWSRLCAAALAWAHLTDQKPETARRLLDDAIDRDSGFDSISLRQCWFRLAEMELADGNPETALEIIDHLIATVPGAGRNHPVAQLAWLRSRALTAIERYEEAHAALADARNRARALGYRPLLWRIDLTATDVYQCLGDREAMADASRRGRDNVNSLSGEVQDASIRAEFRARALSMFHAPIDTETGDRNPFGLSEREREVLALVARGMTDGEAGDALFISPRTVGRHLQSIYNKLGVSSRTAAARLAIERQLI